MVHDVWIGDIVKQAILGLDFLKANMFHLDLDNGMMNSNGAVELRCHEEVDAGCFRVVAGNTIILPPQTESIIKGRIRGTTPADSNWIIEAVATKVPKFIVGEVLACQQDGLVPIRVMNLATNPRKIKKGTD